MNHEALEQTGELRDELDANAVVDPRAIPSRFSLLKQMSLSAAHYWHAAQQPQDDSMAARLGKLSGAQNDPSAALRFGSAVHYMLLGQGDEITVFQGNTKRGTKAWLEFEGKAIDAGFKVLLQPKEHAHARAVADAILRHPIAMDLLFGAGSVVEQRIDWSWSGKAFRSTPDSRSKSASRVVDLKTTSAQGIKAFRWHALRFHYHCQMALYRRAIAEAEGWTPREAFIVAVDKPAPHVVTIYPVDEASLTLGEKQLRLWLEALLEAERSNYWAGYSESPVPLCIPGSEDSAEVDLVFGDGDAA